MKYSNGKKYRRRIGQPRKDYSIHANIGRIGYKEEPNVVFIGKKGEPYCLTPGKTYQVIRTTHGEFHFDKELWERAKALKDNKKRDRRFETSQGEEEMLVLMNDKGNVRKYSHLMFKRVENAGNN